VGGVKKMGSGLFGTLEVKRILIRTFQRISSEIWTSAAVFSTYSKIEHLILNLF
jgi:hypothetical protein